MAELRIPGGRTLYYDDTGDGPPLLLLMGGGGARASWAPLAAAFAPHYRVLTLDNRDAGESPPEAEPYTLGDLAADALALLDGLGLPRAHLLGASMGAFIALHLVLDHPARVERLVLIAASAHVSPPKDMTDAPLPPSWWTDDPVERLRRLLPAVASPAFRARPTFATEVEAAAERERGSLMTLAGLQRQLLACYGHDVRARLGELAAPTLVIQGERDRPEKARELASGIPDARLLLLPDTGHATTVERPDEVARAVLDFLGATQAGPGDEERAS